MSLRPVELGLVALLLVTVTGKLTFAQPGEDADQTLFGESVAAMLQQAGFSTRIDMRPLGSVVEAQRDGCRMIVREYVPQGTFAATVADRGRAAGPLVYFYRGSFFAEPPRLHPLLGLYARRLKDRVGVQAPRTPIIAIAAAPECSAATLPWRRVATLPR